MRIFAPRDVLILFVLCFSYVFAVPAFAETQPCSKLKTERDKAMKTLNSIRAQKLPEDEIAEVGTIVPEMIRFVNDQPKGRVSTQDRIKEMERRLPSFDSGIAIGIDKFVEGISHADLNGEKTKSVSDFLENLKDRLDIVQGFYTAENSSTAREQIEQSGPFLKDLAKALGVDSIPGVNDLIDAYGQGAKSIQERPVQAESTVAHDEKVYKAAGFTGDLYLHPLSPRQKREMMIQNLIVRIEGFEDQISQGACGHLKNPDLCANPNSRVAQDVQHARKAVDNSEIASNLRLIEEGVQGHLDRLSSKDPVAQKQASESYTDDVVRGRLLRQQYEQQLGDLLDTASQSWSDRDIQLMESCYPYYSSLMHNPRIPKPTSQKPQLAK